MENVPWRVHFSFVATDWGLMMAHGAIQALMRYKIEAQISLI